MLDTTELLYPTEICWLGEFIVEQNTDFLQYLPHLPHYDFVDLWQVLHPRLWAEEHYWRCCCYFLVWRLCTVAIISPKTSLLNITTDEWELYSLPRTNGGEHTSWLTPTVPVRTMPLKFPQSTEASWQLPSLFRRMGLDIHDDLCVNLEGEHWSL